MITNSKEKIDLINSDFDFPIPIESDEKEFEIIGYTLVGKEHYSDLHNLHLKKLAQSYKDVFDEYMNYRLKSSQKYNKNFCPLYFVTISPEGEELEINNEIIYYIGSTNQKGNRFSNGHRVTQKLLNPDYKNFEKHIYFFQIWVKYCHLGVEKEVPLEWIKEESLVNDIIIFLEYLFIFQGKYIGNDDGLNKRRRKTNFRPWEDYWPTNDYGISFILDNGIISPFFKEESNGFWPEVMSSLYKEELVKYLENETERMNQVSDEEMEFEFIEEWE